MNYWQKSGIVFERGPVQDPPPAPGRAAKRLAIDRLLDEHPDWPIMNIAHAAGATYTYVSNVKSERKAISIGQEKNRIREIEKSLPPTVDGSLVEVTTVDQPVHAHELAEPVTITFPSRWVCGLVNAKTELENLAETLIRGTEAITGVYMRLCDIIRCGNLPDYEVREILSKRFPHSRVSEIMRVARAPEEVYRRYTAGFFGFRAAVRECRGYQINSNEHLLKRKLQRLAQQIVALTGGQGQVHVGCKVVTVS